MISPSRIVVIGGGPAGIEAATTAARAGANVTLVSDGPVGGRAGWHSLLPSKVWLTTADTLRLFSEADELGIEVDQARPDGREILERIQHVKSTWNAQQLARLNSAGVNIVTGAAGFVDEQRVQVKGEEEEMVLEADYVIIAAGSVPIFPPGLKPDGKRVLAPRFASHLEKLPRSVFVIGAGATGSEFAYMFNRVGVETTWIVDQYGVLPQFNFDAGRFLAQALVRQGVRIIEGQMADRIERDEDGVTVILADGARYEAEMAFVGIGRRPDWDRLNLAAARLTGEGGRISVDGFGRTEVDHIYLVGDALGGWLVANKAMQQARIAALHAVGLDTPPYDPSTVILATYTEPQVAQVGRVEPLDVDDPFERVRVPFGNNLKTLLLPDRSGFLELTFNPETRALLGGVAVGIHAADALAPVALALRLQARVDDLGDVYGAHPTISELAFTAARLAY